MSGHEGSGGERERLDLAATLGELERKLRELERDLAAGPEGSAAPPPDADPTPAADPAPAAAESPREPPGGPPEIDLSAQIEELMRFRERLAHSMRTLLEDCSRMLESLLAIARPAAPGPPPPPGSYSGVVTLDAGPFEEVGRLEHFQRVVEEVPGVRAAAVRRLSGDRAVFEVVLEHPTALIEELLGRAPIEVDTSHGQVVVVTVLPPVA
jgi:hypothetical protein